jgi:diadenosine tetraphosphate (Ap4A) HIT family hydrolase
MVHATILKFGYPQSLVRSYDHWMVQLRPKQATLGALVVICTEDVTSFSALSQAAAAEFHQVVCDVEQVLGQVFAFQKINWLLMMVDPHVHFHVLPRYDGPRSWGGHVFTDPGWPGLPDLSHAPPDDGPVHEALLDELRAAFPRHRTSDAPS